MINWQNITSCKFNKEQRGDTLISALVAVVLVSIIGLGLAKSLISAMKIARHTEINYAASNLASSKIEQLAARDSIEIDSSLNSVETNLTVAGLNVTFDRTTTITTNADDTRTINVTVESNSAGTPTTANFTTSLSVWE